MPSFFHSFEDLVKSDFAGFDDTDKGFFT